MVLNYRELKVVLKKVRDKLHGRRGQVYKQLKHPVQFPEGYDDKKLMEYLKSFRLDGDTSGELDAYLQEDFYRFVYTLNLIADSNGHLLEIGANPYFTSILLRKFMNHATHYTNFFGKDYAGPHTQVMKSKSFGETYDFEFENSNVESEDIPYDVQFDTVVFCEVIEHLTNDPIQVLLRIKKALKKDGALILTTPNVNRLENVAKMIAGANIYDPYSGYGPYGRHNREYNKHELSLLLAHLGFEIEVMFSSDVHENRSDIYCDISQLDSLLKHRVNDLGQYIFIRARNVREAKTCKPSWLYRSYTPDMMCE